MSRFVAFVALVLAMLLPLQLAWGAAASHCQHETEPRAAQHFGHHEHEHQGDVKKAPNGSSVVADSDCGYCHATSAAVVAEPMTASLGPVVGRRVAIPVEQRHASALARAPDRPQWTRLA